MSTPSSSDRPLALIFAGMLAVALWSFTLSWHSSILDRHEFRQTQTAISAYWIKHDGLKLDYETPIFGPPWSVPFEFPVYQTSVAWLSRASGLPLEQSGRLVSVLYFLATLPAVALLAGLFGLSLSRQLLVVAAVVSSPVYLFYGRSFMIETTALCFATWFLVAVGRAVRSLNVRWSIVAAAAGSLAALAKITTFAVYCFPAAGLTLWLGWPHWQRRAAAGPGWGRAVLLAAWPVVAAVALGAWWVIHSDHVKNTNPFAGFMNSTELRSWTWGSLALRMSPDLWHEAWSNIADNVLSESALVVVLLCATAVSRRVQLTAVAGAAAFVGGLLLFPNLYRQHDYYYSANALLLLAAAGGILAAAWNSPRLPRATVLIALLLFFGAQLNAFYRSYGSYHRRELPAPPEIASVIRKVTAPDDVILIYGWDWNTLVPYYAQRRAVMVPRGREYDFAVLDSVLGRLPPRRIEALVVRREYFDPPAAFIRERADSFGLSPVPFATSDAGDLYLPKGMIASASRRIAGQKFPSVTFNIAPPAEAEDTSLKEDDPAGVEIRVVNPLPVRVRSLFGVSMGSLDGRPVVIANAPSEIWLDAPAGATRIIAEFGLVAEAYTGGNPVTDGVGITIYEVRPEGTRRRLFNRELDPVRTVADRGLQRIEVTGADPLAGRLLFKVDPGPNGSQVKDWFFWSQIEVR